MEDRWYGRALPPVLISVVLGLLAWVEWQHVIFKSRPMPWPPTILFLISVPFAAWRIRTGLAELRQRGQGVHGERIVGQLLENLRSVGCKIYHDIAEDGYNIDHVIIGPHGVFAIETKTISKPLRGQAEVVFDGETVTIGGYQPDRDPVIQARAAARSIRKILHEMTGQEPNVIPVLLYVNWFVEPNPRDADVIVMNQEYFLKSFDRLQDRNTLQTPQVEALAARMESYLREKVK